jgi:hypothetical protein
MGIKVKAMQLGYYGHRRRREGDVFEIESENEFSKRWMKKLDAKGQEIEEEDDEDSEGLKSGAGGPGGATKKATKAGPAKPGTAASKQQATGKDASDVI